MSFKEELDDVIEGAINHIYAHQAIEKTLYEMRDMLLEKNKQYGNSAFKPSRMFSRISVAEGLLVRLDDKVSRLRNMVKSQDVDPEDTILDLFGYLVLARVANQLIERGEIQDECENSDPSR